MVNGVSDDGSSFIFMVKQKWIKVLRSYLTENTVKAQLFFSSLSWYVTEGTIDAQLFLQPQRIPSMEPGNSVNMAISV